MKEKVREATIKLVFRILVAVLIFDFFYLILTLVEEYFVDLSAVGTNMMISYSAAYHLGLILFQVFLISYLFIGWFITSYIIEEEHITARSGLIVKRDKVINFNNVRMVDYKQGLLARIFDYGDIVFEMVGGGKDFVIKGIESPKKIVQSVKSSISEKK